ncbi:FAD-dependent oxidoreductase [Emcibacter nanhaiensis]|uniref:2-polyprenyl-6-methoxyphenol hydroxylase n=1 Tax=Emcibacter nanhaiensis TaxID=1505037 RepID=A0A501PFY7_9PROT|nr:FAD-dependent oxidoreductase [Emcibacter nanhaiensis]TPD59048.1 2-polyprenyl-6-methoxyphenol hydroxylase [Emcibacter nanhaiensis]
MAIRKVLIIGGGIGGLCAAIGFRRKGIEVDLVEISETSKVYHVGIIVQANVVRALKELGVADEAVAVGFPYSGFEMQDPEGNTIVREYGPKLAGEDYPTDLGMARPALHDVLIKATRETGANMHFGVTFEKLDDQGDHVHVTFTDGSEGDYDMVIGADGAYSSVRKFLFPDLPAPKFTGQGVWRYNLPRPKDVTHSVMMDGIPGGKAGYVPLTEDTIYILYVGAEPGNPFFPTETLADEFKKRLEPYGGRIPELAKQITDPELVVYRPLEVCFVPDPWYRGRIVLMGDAAHAGTPHLGQGAAQAIEDAVVLAELAATEQEMEPMLRHYMDRRLERTRFIWESSIQIGEWEQHPTPDANAAALMKKMLEVVSAPI